MNFSTVSKFFIMKEFFHSQAVFLQSMIFSQSQKFSAKTFTINEVVENFFSLDQGGFPQNKDFYGVKNVFLKQRSKSFSRS